MIFDFNYSNTYLYLKTMLYKFVTLYFLSMCVSGNRADFRSDTINNIQQLKFPGTESPAFLSTLSIRVQIDNNDICGGARIKHNVVLATAVCVLSAKQYRITVMTPNDSNSYLVTQIIPHPRYKKGSDYFDVAIIYFDTDKNNQFLLNLDELFYLNSASVVGWTYDESGQALSTSVRSLQLENSFFIYSHPSLITIVNSFNYTTNPINLFQLGTPIISNLNPLTLVGLLTSGDNGISKLLPIASVIGWIDLVMYSF